MHASVNILTPIYSFNHTVSFCKMPVSKINSEKALTVIAAELSAMHGMTVDSLLADYKHLDEIMESSSKFNWERVGSAIGQTR